MQIDRKIPVPISEEAYVVFSVDEMQALYEYYGEGYIQRVVSGIDTFSLPTARKCLEISLKNANITVDQVLERYPFTTIAGWLLDAISMSIYGRRTTSEG